MLAELRFRDVYHAFVLIAVLTVALQGHTRVANASPHVFLSREASSIQPGHSAEIDVFVEDVVDLRLYEVVLEVTGGAVGSLDLTNLVIDETRPDFVFTGISPLLCLPDQDGLRITCSPLSDDCVSVTAPPAYLGTYTFTASADADGTFTVNIVDDPATFLLDCDGSPITPLTLTHATVDIEVVEVPVPAVSAWGATVMGLLMLTAATLVFRQRLGSEFEAR